MAKSRWLPRFSLCTLLCAVLLIGSAATLRMHWEPWVRQYNVMGNGKSATFSPNSSKVAIEGSEVVVVDLETGAIIVQKPGQAGADKSETLWSKDGRWFSYVWGWGREKYGLIWNVHHWSAEPIAEADLKNHIVSARPGFAADAYGRNIALPSSDDGDWITDCKYCKSADGRSVAVAPENCGLVKDDPRASASVYDESGSELAKLTIPRPIQNGAYFVGAISPDGNWSVACSPQYPNAIVWHRRHPEYWWGVAWLPEFWLTIGIAGRFLWSVRKDSRDGRVRAAAEPA